jgi:hypothetical protein
MVPTISRLLKEVEMPSRAQHYREAERILAEVNQSRDVVKDAIAAGAELAYDGTPAMLAEAAIHVSLATVSDTVYEEYLALDDDSIENSKTVGYRAGGPNG